MSCWDLGSPHIAPKLRGLPLDRKSTRLNSSRRTISYAVFCLKKKKNTFAYDSNARSLQPLHLYSEVQLLPISRPDQPISKFPAPLYAVPSVVDARLS